MKVALIGKGNLGTHLYQVLNEKVDLQWFGRDFPNSIDADIVIVSISDSQTAQVCAQIEAPLVVHTAGALSMLDSTNAGVFYPLYSFTKDAAVDWTQIPFLIETSDAQHISILEELVRTIGGKLFHITSEQRTKLHAAAVMVNNFTNHLYTLAEEHCEDYQLPFEVLYAIMEQGPGKAIELGPKQAQTGPANRGDQNTIKAHLEQINNPQTKELYSLLSESIFKRNEL